ncbi:unnamed protein product [Linum trigynum]|uniref:Uncharacterized protein n=1 Tax=Linum trigynum TaxID=586398 RepID=A0AAV2CTM0_9ROSI
MLSEIARSLEKLNVFYCNLGISKLEPDGENAIELINRSGLYHLESADKNEVTLTNMLTSTAMKASSR